MRKFRIVSVLLMLLYATQTFSQTTTLKFKNNQFKIVQFTDLHLINGEKYAAKNDSTYMLMRQVIHEENPDMVVLTGDVVVSGGATQLWEQVIQPMTETKVPFAVTFGNHDTETDLTKAQILKLLQKNKYNMTHNARENMNGSGTCSLPILSEKGSATTGAIYLFDSHAYTQDKKYGVYDWIRNDQIQWYREQSDVYAQKAGKPVPALAFFHIPFPEFELIRKKETALGCIVEPVCSPNINSGLFASFVEKNDILGVFVGHDHNNDYVGTLADICLCFGRKTGYTPAYHEVLERGARVIKLYENEAKFDTYIRSMTDTCLNYTFTRD